MQQQVEQFILKGMQRDTSISKANNEFSFENMNIRITAREDDTLLSITNEKGNKAFDGRVPNIIRVRNTEEDQWEVYAQFYTETNITGTVMFSDVDGENESIKTWEITKGTNSVIYDVYNDIGPYNLTIDTPYDDKYYYILEGQEITPKYISIEGECLGYAVLNKYLIVFTKQEYYNSPSIDYIQLVNFSGEIPEVSTLYSGDLNFSIDHPIETLAIYENENIQKVYWVDGINQPRTINIVATEEEKIKWNNSYFDAVPTLSLSETVEITRDKLTNGVFAPGVIQYVLTYFNKYGQESNPFYTSPLYYTSYQDRGGSPEDKISNSFNIRILNAEEDFDYIRVYSLLRTSINAIPEARKVVDLYYKKTLSRYKWALKNPEKTGSFLYLPTSLGGTSSISNILLYKTYTENSISDYISLDSLEYTQESDDLENITRVYNISKLSEYSIIYIRGNYYTNIDTIRLNSCTEEGNYSDGNIYFKSYFLDGPSSNTSETSPILIESSGYTSSSIEYKGIYEVEFNDNGSIGETIDPTELLYVGGEDITVGTITQKDNTLFLGNLKLNKKVVSEKIRDLFKNQENKISYYYEQVKDCPPKGYYPYENQLKYSSHQIKGFKYREWYRFGIQFQHKTGKWTEPIWIEDSYNTLPVKNDISTNTETGEITANTISIPKASYCINDPTILYELEKNDFIKIRPVIVYPKLTDRESICQGILCPTVYNLEDRMNNAPFVQSSWFVRANNAQVDQDEYYAYPTELQTDASIEEINNDFNTKSNGGVQIEFRHNAPIPSNRFRSGEIQCIWKPETNLKKASLYFDFTSTDEEKNPAKLRKWVSGHSECFYVDQSILTLHSPEIEFDDNIQNLDGEDLKLRIVGAVPITSFCADIDIQTSTPPIPYYSSELGSPPGFYKQGIIGVENIDLKNGGKSLSSGIFWLDSTFLEQNADKKNALIGYAIYPFQSNGSLNNQRVAVEGYRYAELKSKKLSNLRYSYITNYFKDIWTAETGAYTGISGTQIINSNELEQFKIKAPKYSNLEDFIYYSNIDKVIVFNTDSEILMDNTDTVVQEQLQNSRAFGYPTIVSAIEHVDIIPFVNTAAQLEKFANIDYNKYYSDKYYAFYDFNKNGGFAYDTKRGNIDAIIHNKTTYNIFKNDPVRIKYKSTPHAVLALNYTVNGEQSVLPKLYNQDLNSAKDEGEGFYYWSKGKVTSINQGSIFEDYAEVENNISNNLLDIDSHLIPSYLYIAELYNDNVQNRFGGQTQEAFENNEWLPCGEAISIYEDAHLKEEVVLKWLEGDTYYQRYDHIKTYPFALEDQNCISDIISFMCETRVNLDGRYDRNRGNLTNFTITPENFNKINNVYNQENNFFVYRALNYDKFSLDNFANSITWTKEKQLGELVDTWTNITVASTLDLDGEKGEIASLNTFNNEVFAFQKHGISHILFNSRVQIPASDGVPIEITNGLKVDGKRYVSEIGCHNKWSIAQSPNGIYFIDNISNGIYLFTGQSLEPISEKLGFSQWVGENGTMDIWNKEYKNFRTFYDKVNGDVYFTTKDTSLCFSETLGQFTSFMNYENLPAMFNVDNKFYSIKNNIIWEHNSGDYNYFYGEYKPYYIKYRVNPNPYKDKIFTNIEFRADTFNDNVLTDITFNKLLVENEYQQGELELKYNKILPSTLKKKFRMWRTNIPRDKSNKRDRIRNPWIYLQLLKDVEDNYKTEFHDLLVYYFD